MTFPVTRTMPPMVATTILLLIPARPSCSWSATHWRGAGSGDGRRCGAWRLGDSCVPGLGALLAASAEWFVIEWVGAAYLVWLGIKMWRAPPVLEEVDDAMGRAPDDDPLDRHGALGIIFFIAFVPQFMDPTGLIAPVRLAPPWCSLS